MDTSPLIERLIAALRCLPGVGPRSAIRLAFHLLERDRDGGRRLAQALLAAMEGIGRCDQCRTLSEDPVCPLCATARRDPAKLCVVETPADLVSIERATGFDGRYFVLHGRLSPLDGVGPAALGLDLLEARLLAGEVGEVIVATGGTLEGEATAHYIAELAHSAKVRVSRLAHGIPMGGDLDHLDAGTLSYAMLGRREM